MVSHDADLRYAFNLGCDDFLRGREFEDNPYLILTPMYLLWQEGWLDCRDNFGVDPRANHRRRNLCRCNSQGDCVCLEAKKGA